MNTKTFLLFVLIILTLYSCNNREINPLNLFQNVPSKILKGYSIKMINDTVLIDPRDLLIRDSVAIIYDINNEYAYSIINLSNGSLLKRIGQVGNGENKVDIGSLSMNKTLVGGRFSATQINRPSKMIMYDLESFSNGNNSIDLTSIKLPKELYLSSTISLSNGSIFGAVSHPYLNDGHMYNLYVPESSEIFSFGELPDIGNDKYYYKSDIINWTISSLNFYSVKHPSLDVVVTIARNGAGLFITKINADNSIELINESFYYLPKFTVAKGKKISKAVPHENNRMGFISITVTDKKIYALYSGKLIGDDGLDNLRSNQILVYNWKGEPIEKIELDRECYSISVDSNNPKKLFGLIGIDNTDVISYNLKDD